MIPRFLHVILTLSTISLSTIAFAVGTVKIADKNMTQVFCYDPTGQICPPSAADELDEALAKIDKDLFRDNEADIHAWLDARIVATGEFGVYPFTGKYVQIHGDRAIVDLNRGCLADTAAQFLRAYEMFGKKKYLEAGLKTADFFLQIQQPAGHFPYGAIIERGGKAAAETGKHPPGIARMEDGYQFRPFALLLYAYKLSGHEKYLCAAKRCGELVTQKMQHPQWGWCPDVFDTRKQDPYLHGKSRHGSFGVDGGGSYSDFATTDGFRTAVIMYHLTKDKKYLRRSARLGRWIFSTQLGKGKVRGWADNYDAQNHPVPARPFEGRTIDPRNFNRFVGPLLTWLYAVTAEEKYRILFQESYIWMRQVEHPDGWACEYTREGHEAWTQDHKTYRYDQPETWPEQIHSTFVRDGCPTYGRDKVVLRDSKIIYELLQEGGHAALRRWYKDPVKYDATAYQAARLAAARRCTNENVRLRLQIFDEPRDNEYLPNVAPCIYLRRVRLRLAGLDSPNLPEYDCYKSGRRGLLRQAWIHPYEVPLGVAAWQYAWDVRLATGQIDPETAAPGGRGLEAMHHPLWDVMSDWTTRCIEVEDWFDLPLRELEASFPED